MALIDKLAKASKATEPPKFPMSFKVFLRRAFGGRLHSERLHLFRKFLVKSFFHSFDDPEGKAAIAWTNDVPIYNNAIQDLYDILKKEAEKCGDGIAKTPGYFQCIPKTTLDDTIGDTTIAEIRFINKTNLSFQIVITHQVRSHGEIIARRELHIICSSGGLFFSHQRDTSSIGIRIPDGENWATINGRDIVKQKLKLLVASQIENMDSGKKQ